VDQTIILKRNMMMQSDAARIKQSDVLSTFQQINDRHFISTLLLTIILQLK
jgi:hypothetical protein